MSRLYTDSLSHVFFDSQETVPASQKTYLAQDLHSGTEYLVTVIAQYPNRVGESVSAKARTSENIHSFTLMPMLELLIAQILLQERVLLRHNKL